MLICVMMMKISIDKRLESIGCKVEIRIPLIFIRKRMQIGLGTRL